MRYTEATHMSNDIFTETIISLEKNVNHVSAGVDSALQPARKNIIKRFPILFALAVTLGVSSVYFGFERLLSEIAFLNDHPVVMIGIGLCILVVTGTVYKKL
jgi:uncharacterized integral membrane protein